MLSESCHRTAGWDIGGAHLKLAYIYNRQLVTHQWDCPLWKGLDELISVFKLAVKEIPDAIDTHNVTMTGELVDIFKSHDDGVEQIMLIFTQCVSDNQASWFCSINGLLSFDQALKNKSLVASANWAASASLVAKYHRNAIFIDMGSTTTDVLQIYNNNLVINGKCDFERLISGELVYTGVVRSCVNTLCNEIPFRKAIVPLMAENFSNAADVYRILEWLPNYADYGLTMDGNAKDIISSMVRLARMVGKDYRPEDMSEWYKVSEYIAGQQMLKVESSILPVLRANTGIKSIVGAGVGTFLIKMIAERLFLSYIDYADCIVPKDIQYKKNISDCAPAVALVFMEPKTD